MKLVDAEKMALELMKKYGLKGWKFKFFKSRRIIGQCVFTRSYKLNFYKIKKTTAVGECYIGLSSYFVLVNEEKEIRDTILHEIAHALTPGHGHGFYWKKACKIIGAIPERLADENVKSPPTKYVAVCNDCNITFKQNRIIKNGRYNVHI